MRWGRPIKNNKKHRDPRYFLTEGSDWPEDKTEDAMMGRARGLAQRGMENQISGERPPWEAEDQEGDGFTDASLDESDFDLLKNIYKHLSTVSGGGGRGEAFADLMSKLGIDLGAPEGSEGAEGPEVGADEMEDSLGRFRNKLGR